jgi:hypothetical protein
MAIAKHNPLDLKSPLTPNESWITSDVARVARNVGVPYRPLLLQALLQLPRIANEDGRVSQIDAHELLRELALELPSGPEWQVRSWPSDVTFLRYGPLERVDADRIMERYHYLRSARTDGRAYALFTDLDEIGAVAISSPLDVRHIQQLLAETTTRARRARVISRVFVFEGSPANSISYLLARVARSERECDVSDLVTYVNPNVGFTGVSYRASGWTNLGVEAGTKYRYIDQRYITSRRLESMFGAHDDQTYSELLGPRFGVSTMQLAPLLLFHTRIDKLTSTTRARV